MMTCRRRSVMFLSRDFYSETTETITIFVHALQALQKCAKFRRISCVNLTGAIPKRNSMRRDF